MNASKVSRALCHLAQANLSLSRGIMTLANISCEPKLRDELKQYSKTLKKNALTLDKISIIIDGEVEFK